MKKQKVSPKATVGQVRGVSEMLRGRRCRASQGGIGIEVRGTSRFEVIDEMIASWRAMVLSSTFAPAICFLTFFAPGIMPRSPSRLPI